MHPEKLRLLPWTTPDGKPCYLSPSPEGSRISRRADQIEAEQIKTARQVLVIAKVLLNDPTTPKRELRFVGQQLSACLNDAVRIAKSRGELLEPAEADEEP